MNKSKFILTRKDSEMLDLLNKTDHKVLGVWAIACAMHVIPYFERPFPDDKRPRKALETLKDWINTGKFSMKVIRGASLGSHAAAREVGEDNPARSAARACGQAAATAHVPRHAYGSAIYAQQAVYRASTHSGESAAKKEREWQYNKLLKLNTKDRK